jgi:hypothetical protein
VREALANGFDPEILYTVQAHATRRFALERLVTDLDGLYQRLLEERDRQPVRPRYPEPLGGDARS